MDALARKRPSAPATVVFDLLNPLPFGLFVGALVFDATYFDSGEILWDKGAVWLIVLGLVCAIVPRLVNLVQVWVTRSVPRAGGVALAFWLNVLAIVAAIVNAFVHSRDAYASMPEGLWLSIATVALLAVASVIGTLATWRAGDVR